MKRVRVTEDPMKEEISRFVGSGSADQDAGRACPVAKLDEQVLTGLTGICGKCCTRTD